MSRPPANPEHIAALQRAHALNKQVQGAAPGARPTLLDRLVAKQQQPPKAPDRAGG